VSKFPEYFECDCCGYKTLKEGGGGSYEICYLCRWEDEIVSSFFFIDEVIGGANGDYSLKEARENFHKYFIMYRIADPERYFSIFKDAIEAKKKIIEILDAIEYFKNHEGLSSVLDMEYLKLKLALLELDEAEDKIEYRINVRTGKILKKK